MKARTAKRIALAILCLVAVFLSACADFGAGLTETSFYDYFSGVYMLSHDGMHEKDIKDFNMPISMEESDKIEEAVPEREYAYIAFRVAGGYTLAVDEFAFFAKGIDGGTLELDFFIADKIPTKLEDTDGSYTYFPDISVDDPESTDHTHYDGDRYYPTTNAEGTVETRANEVDESAFSGGGYAKTSFELSAYWNSAHLEFPEPQTVRAGQYIVIRVQNNCKAPDGTVPAPVKFTINYLMFRFL